MILNSSNGVVEDTGLDGVRGDGDGVGDGVIVGCPLLAPVEHAWQGSSDSISLILIISIYNILGH
jgi:hypothetical protein